jgi:hypothetical protein
MSAIQNFKTSYSESNLTSLGIKGYQESRADDGIFRNLLIEWNSLTTKTSYNEDLPCWFIFTDVLKIDKEIILTQETVIFARRIEVADDAGLIIDLTSGSDQNVMIFTQEIIDSESNEIGKLKITRLNSDETTEEYYFASDSADNGSTGITWNGKINSSVNTISSKEIEATYMIEGEPLRLLVMTQFQYATLISTDDINLSMMQFRWISSIASCAPATLEIATQASSFAMTLQATKAAGPNALLVPILDLEIYAQDAKSYMELLKDRENYWNSYKIKTEMDQQWAEDAKVQLAIQSNELDLDQKLENQAHDTYKQVLNARSIASKQLSSTLAEVVVKRYDFDAGVKKWERQKTIDEVFNLVTGVAEILMEIPAIVAAGPEMAAMPIMETVQAGVQIGLEGVKMAKEIFDSPPTTVPEEIEMTDLSGGDDEQDATPIAGTETEDEKKQREIAKTKAAESQKKLKDSLSKAGSGAKKVFDAAMNIAKISATADAMQASSANILSTSTGTVDTSFSTFSVQGVDVVTGGAQDWDNLSLELDNSFSNISELRDIDGGTDYQLELRKLIIAGKTLSMAKLAMAKAASDLASAKLRKKSKENTVAIVNKRLKDITKTVAMDDTITQLIFNRVLDARRAVYMAMESYRRAYQYFTLANNSYLPILPKLTDTYSTFSAAVAQISSKKLQSLELAKYGTIPQTIPNLDYSFNDPSLVKSLRENGIVTFDINTNDDNFKGFGRVRFSCVRVFITGLDPNLDAKIQVDIANSGLFADKNPDALNQIKRFVGMETLKSFVYNNLNAAISFDGDVAARYENDFFKPTPFTTWTIRVSRQDGKPLDLYQITGFKLSIEGEATPQISSSGAKQQMKN